MPFPSVQLSTNHTEIPVSSYQHCICCIFPKQRINTPQKSVLEQEGSLSLRPFQKCNIACSLHQHISLVYSNIHWPKDKVQETHLLQHTHLKYKHYSYYGILKAYKNLKNKKNCTHLPGERNCSHNSYIQKLQFL